MMSKKNISLTKEEIKLIDLWYRTKEEKWPGDNDDENDLYKKLTGKRFVKVK